MPLWYVLLRVMLQGGGVRVRDFANRMGRIAHGHGVWIQH